MPRWVQASVLRGCWTFEGAGWEVSLKAHRGNAHQHRVVYLLRQHGARVLASRNFQLAQ